MTCWGEIKYKNMYFFKKKLKIFKNFFMIGNMRSFVIIYN